MRSFPSLSVPTLSLGLLVGGAQPAAACASCQFDMLGPSAGQYLLALLVWMVATAVLGSYSTVLQARRGTRKPEAVRSPWPTLTVLLLTLFFGGAVLGPVVFFFWAIYFFIKSLTLLVSPKPVPFVVLGLAVALVLTFKTLGALDAQRIEEVGGGEMWALIHQHPHSRSLRELSRDSTSTELESLLRRAEQRDDVPEANLKWLRQQVERANEDS